MKEKLYFIPVNDAYDKDCECPVCAMYNKLESEAIDFVMGPSYMEDDIRLVTNKTGFCKEHLRLMYKNQNRLGLALMLLTHTENIIKETSKLQNDNSVEKRTLFSKNKQDDKISEYCLGLKDSCYVCQRIENVFDRYIATIFYLYKTEEDFRKKLEKSKGMCVEHYAVLRKRAALELSGENLKSFINTIDNLFTKNMKRVRDDLEWYTDKFDYRYENEPWKNSKDAIQRTMEKLKCYNPDNE